MKLSWAMMSEVEQREFHDELSSELIGNSLGILLRRYDESITPILELMSCTVHVLKA